MKVIRFENKEVLSSLDKVKESINSTVQRLIDEKK
jgi:very-short-patch-repair endonuclease